MSTLTGVKRTNTCLGTELDQQGPAKRQKGEQEEPAVAALPTPRAQLCMQEGQTLQKAHRFVDAIKKFQEAIEAPDATHRMKAFLWNHIGNSQSDLGMINEAINACRQACKFSELCPNDSHINIASSCNLCNVLISRATNQDLDEAVKTCKRLLQNLQPIKDDPEHVAKIYLNLISALLTRNADRDNEDLIHYAQIALALKIDDPDMRGWFLCDKGDALRRLNKFEEALRCYAEGMELYDKLDHGLKARMKGRFETTLKVQIKEKLTEQAKLAAKIAELEKSKASVADQLDKLNAALKKTADLA